MRWFKRVVTPALVITASLVMWLEESLWEGLKRFTHWIALFPLIRRMEAAILRLPAHAVMIVFLLPMVILFPLKLIAVYCLTVGHWGAAAVLILFAKILGTAIAARMYVVCQPKLMSIAWFRLLHDRLIALRDRLYVAVRSLPIYLAARVLLLGIKERIRELRRQLKGPHGIAFRWRAIRRLMRSRILPAARSRDVPCQTTPTTKPVTERLAPTE